MKIKAKLHRNAKEAYLETTKSNTHAVVVVTYMGESQTSRDYYSFRSNKDEYQNAEDLANDFPYCLGSNQYIREIDQFDE